MGDTLAILVLGLIFTSQLWEGVQCGHFELNAPKHVSVQKGLCVAIPCNFTFDNLHPLFDNEDTLYGYWYENGKDKLENPAFATNDRGKTIAWGARGRFNLSEKLDEGNCSLFITDAQERDEKKYVFRIEKGEEGKYSFRDNVITVTVTETPTPEVQILGRLRAGQPVNLTCTAASCPWKFPEVSWEFMRNISWILHPLSNGTVSSFVPNFVPSAADNGQSLACRVTYGSGPVSLVTSVKRINLNVSYPPQQLQIRGERIEKNGREENLTGLSYVEAQEGDTLQLRCVVEGNPSPQVTWVHKSQFKTRRFKSSNPLTLPGMTQQDMGGYTCRAQNMEGSSEITFQVYMAYRPKACSQANTSCWKEGDGFRCNCSICSFPGPEIQWEVDGKTVKGNTSNNEMEVISWYKKDKAVSILHLKGAQNGRQSVLCHGNSSSGETTLNFLLFHFKENSLKQNITSGVIGAIIMFVIVVIIVLVVVACRNQKCQRASKSITDPETCTDRSMLAFSGNPSDVKGSEVTTPPNQEEAKSVPKEPEKPEKSPDDSYADPEDLYYATIQFSGLKPVPDMTLEEGTTEYAEIKTL